MEYKIFNTYNIAVKTLSPVHVGMGQERNFVRGLDFVVDNAEIKILNNSILLNKLKEVGQLQTLTTKLGTGKYADIESFIKPYLKIEGVVSQIYTLNGNPREDIKRQIVTGLGETIIPGSSIKGALRSVLYADLKQKQSKQKDEKALFGSTEANLMRFIRIADLTFKNEDKRVYPTKIFSGDGDPLSNDGGIGKWKFAFRGGHKDRFEIEGFESYYEAIKSNSVAELKIQIGSNLPSKFKTFANGSSKKKDKFGSEIDAANVTNYSEVIQDKKIEDFFDIIRKHTNNYIDKEIAYFNQFKNDAFDVCPKLQEIKVSNNEINSCVLRVGAGVGFHSITGDWQDVSEDHFSSWIVDGEVFLKSKQKVKDHYYKKLDNQIFAKTRKITIDKGGNNTNIFQPMGFIKLTLLSAEEIEKAKLQAIEDEVKRLKEEQEANEQAEQRVKEVAIAEEKRIEKEKIAGEEAKKPKMFEGILKVSDIIDAEVVGVIGNKAKLKLYAPNQSKNIRDFTYNGLLIGQTLQVIVKAIAKSNGFVVAIDFQKFK